MLSSDLRNLSLNVAVKAGEIGLADPFHAYLMRVAESLQDLRDKAEAMEKNSVRAVTLVDLSDDKIVLFPIAKRPIPINEGGLS